MESKIIEERIKSRITELWGINPDAITNEKALVNDLGADDLDSVELIMALEEEFGIAIDETDGEKISKPEYTVGQLIEYIKSRSDAK